jgi:hypothetical protein
VIESPTGPRADGTRVASRWNPDEFEARRPPCPCPLGAFAGAGTSPDVRGTESAAAAAAGTTGGATDDGAACAEAVPGAVTLAASAGTTTLATGGALADGGALGVLAEDATGIALAEGAGALIGTVLVGSSSACAPFVKYAAPGPDAGTLVASAPFVKYCAVAAAARALWAVCADALGGGCAAAAAYAMYCVYSAWEANSQLAAESAAPGT